MDHLVITIRVVHVEEMIYYFKKKKKTKRNFGKERKVMLPIIKHKQMIRS